MVIKATAYYEELAKEFMRLIDLVDEIVSK